ncbi:MAG: helix-hairpin-helix domain-containing protein [Deltaproteobacteria bacterium]|nr:helix-hairpin-helix domain-containing protein [Deltaproteobacteria bacterium]
MNSRGKETRESSPEVHRSYLFLSMILLVWNTLETGGDLFRPGFPSLSGLAGKTSIGSVTPPMVPALDNEISPMDAPLSVRQKYLIGKRIDINKALKDDINSLPGVSDAMADAILAERERIGRFRSPQDLLRVKGIKEKRLKKILPFLEKMENN